VLYRLTGQQIEPTHAAIQAFLLAQGVAHTCLFPLMRTYFDAGGARVAYVEALYKRGDADAIAELHHLESSVGGVYGSGGGIDWLRLPAAQVGVWENRRLVVA
jgi:hypothetical protein